MNIFRMNGKFIWALCVLPAVCFAAGRAWAQTSRGRGSRKRLNPGIQFQVRNREGGPVPFSLLRVWGPGPELLNYGRTGKNGSVTLSIPPGKSATLVTVTSHHYPPKVQNIRQAVNQGKPILLTLEDGIPFTLSTRTASGAQWRNGGKAWARPLSSLKGITGRPVPFFPLIPPQEGSPSKDGRFSFTLPKSPYTAFLVLPSGGKLSVFALPFEAIRRGKASVRISAWNSGKFFLKTPGGLPAPGRVVDLFLDLSRQPPLAHLFGLYLWKPLRGFGSWRRIVSLISGKDGSFEIPFGFPGKILLFPRGGAGPPGRYIMEQNTRQRTVIWDPGCSLEARLFGFPWPSRSLEVRLEGEKGQGVFPGIFKRKAFSWKRLPSGTYSIRVRSSLNPLGEWVCPCSPAKISIHPSKILVRINIEYGGPPLAPVTGRINFPSRNFSRKDSRVEFRGELGKWMTKLTLRGELKTLYIPAGNYQVLLLGADSGAIIKEHFALPPGGARLDETVPILKKEIVFLHKDGRPARDVTLSGQLNTGKMGVIWGGYIASHKGRAVLRGNPGSVWEIQVIGKSSPGQKALYRYTLLPGEKSVLEVRLPW